MKKWLVLLSSVATLSGCASVFDPSGASSSYSCDSPNDPNSTVDGVTCKTPMAVYSSTHEPAPLQESDLPIGVSLKDYNKEEEKKVKHTAKGNKTVMDAVYRGQGYQLPGLVVPQDQAKYARPVRVPATVMRIWLAPWIDSKDDLHFPSHIYTEIQARTWAFGENEFSGRGMVVPTKVLDEVPVSKVQPNDRQLQEPTMQLQPYEPTGAGTAMPSLP